MPDPPAGDAVPPAPRSAERTRPWKPWHARPPDENTIIAPSTRAECGLYGNISPSKPEPRSHTSPKLRAGSVVRSMSHFPRQEPRYGAMFCFWSKLTSGHQCDHHIRSYLWRGVLHHLLPQRHGPGPLEGVDDLRGPPAGMNEAGKPFGSCSFSLGGQQRRSQFREQRATNLLKILPLLFSRPSARRA